MGNSLGSRGWDATHIGDLQGQLAIVTGCNSGIGFYTALELVRHGATVVCACRNEQRAHEAIDKMLALLQTENQSEQPQSFTNQLVFLRLDLSDLKSVRSFCEQFQQRFDHLDLLINNAGMICRHFVQTKDEGLELQFVTNHLGHFLMTSLLFDSLRRSHHARVINLSSVAHYQGKMDFDVLAKPQASKYSSNAAYATSKLCALLFTFELDRRLREANIDNVKAVTCHPGITTTEFVSNYGKDQSFFVSLATKIANWAPVYQSAEMGALPTLFAATFEDVNSGDYIGPNGFQHIWGSPALNPSSKSAKSPELASRLWQLSEQLAKCRFDVTQSVQKN